MINHDAAYPYMYPYTPSATAVTPDPIRVRAMEMAIDCHRACHCSLEGLLHNAKAIEKYLRSGE